MSIDDPLSTISCSGAHHLLIQPFIMAIGQTSAKSRNRKISEPLSTICTKQEHCLVNPVISSNIELGFIMLQPHELSTATGFPKDYKFTGNKSEVVKQIGNAVPPNFAKAIFSQALKEIVA